MRKRLFALSVVLGLLSPPAGSPALDVGEGTPNPATVHSPALEAVPSLEMHFFRDGVTYEDPA